MKDLRESNKTIQQTLHQIGNFLFIFNSDGEIQELLLSFYMLYRNPMKGCMK
ncbi:hypothetical protein ZOSMA_12G00420 [Zostera marina]|uniref:Uncharacterized protein n=1 Tax=Zostera marina TaxID=29655 RepID=A0A0K9PZ66_ZOSMR|nr:hypothetical protein ZOSMA_12G00420 [Zostera marina]